MLKTGQYSQRGVALIEVLVSVLLLAVGILGVIGLQGTMIQASTESRNRANATLFAGEIVSTLWTTSAASDFSSYSGALPSTNPVASRIVSTLPNGTATLTGSATGSVTVAVSWQMPNAETASTVTQTAVISPLNEALVP